MRAPRWFFPDTRDMDCGDPAWMWGVSIVIDTMLLIGVVLFCWVLIPATLLGWIVKRYRCK